MASSNRDNINAFFYLLRAGLWSGSNNKSLSSYDKSLLSESVDYKEIYRIAREQTVLGVVADGISRTVGIAKGISEDEMGQVMGEIIYLEMLNSEMNSFIRDLITKMNAAGIYTLIVKGQGIAQCYDKPQWRAVGDVDLFLDAENYEKDKIFIEPIAKPCEDEDKRRMHACYTMGDKTVELHGTLYSGLSKRIDNVIEEVQRDTFENKKVRIWKNGDVEVPLPAIDNDLIFIFSHIIQHFYKEGVGLRQLCDWCRFLFTYKGQFDLHLLENRLKEMKVMTEWKVFGVIAVERLGLPEDAFPFYEVSSRYRRKAEKVLKVILEVGNFGHNRDKSYFKKHSYLVRKAISLWKNGGYIVHNIGIFPANSLKYLPRFLFGGFRATAKGK